jgi:hypothetical protein
MHLMNAIRAGLACSLMSLLAACGGGGGDGGSTGTAPLSSTYPTSGPTAGDWYSYTQTTQATLPVASTTTRHFTRHYSQLADGSQSYVETGSDASAVRVTAVLDGSLAIVSEVGCTYSPAFRAAPPLGAAAGTSYSSTVTRTCPNAIAAQRVATVNTSGKADGPESHAVALGTLNTFKSTRTVSTSFAADVQRTVSTCWEDMGTGVMVECARQSTTAANATAPAHISSSSRTELIAYGRSGQAAVGPVVRRFAGGWTVQFSGDDSGRCDSIRVALDGAITGSCNFGQSYPVSGRITDSGAVTVTVSNGAELTGNAGSPLSASGSWKLGNASGNWVANHR